MDDETRLVARTQAAPAATGETNPAAPLAPGELATKIVAALDVIAAIIPDLRTPHPDTAKRVRGARTVSREAVTSILAMVEAIPALQRATRLDPDRAREVLDSMDDFRLIAERLAMLQAQVRYTAEERWADLVHSALTAYTVADRLAKDPAKPEAAAHVATIRRHLGRRNGTTGKRKKTRSGD